MHIIVIRIFLQIDIALSFNGEMRHSYPAPPSANVTTISLAFRPAQVEFGTLFYTSTGTDSSDMGMGPDQGISLRLFNGSIQFGYDGEGMVSTAEEVLQVDQWYQLYASRLV